MQHIRRLLKPQGRVAAVLPLDEFDVYYHLANPNVRKATLSLENPDGR